MRYLLLLLLCSSTGLRAQKVLQLERFGNPNSERIEIGSFLTYQVVDDEIWYRGVIRDLRVDQQVIEFDDRFLALDRITALQYERAWPRQIGTQLALFGAAWSGWALVGTLTDGNPDTNYRWSDAIVTGSSAAVGFSLPLVFGKKTVQLGKRRRLRMLDLSFR